MQMSRFWFFLHDVLRTVSNTACVKGKYVTGKSALKLVKLPSLKVICWKLTKIWLLKVAKFYRRLNGGVSQTCPHPSPHPIMHIHVQTSVNFRTFADLHFRSLRTFHFQILQGALPSAVDGFSLTTPCQKLKKPWRGFFQSHCQYCQFF